MSIFYLDELILYSIYNNGSTYKLYVIRCMRYKKRASDIFHGWQNNVSIYPHRFHYQKNDDNKINPIEIDNANPIPIEIRISIFNHFFSVINISSLLNLNMTIQQIFRNYLFSE